jgi:hypothetical protein
MAHINWRNGVCSLYSLLWRPSDDGNSYGIMRSTRDSCRCGFYGTYMCVFVLFLPGYRKGALFESEVGEGICSDHISQTSIQSMLLEQCVYCAATRRD